MNPSYPNWGLRINIELQVRAGNYGSTLHIVSLIISVHRVGPAGREEGGADCQPVICSAALSTDWLIARHYQKWEPRRYLLFTLLSQLAGNILQGSASLSPQYSKV